MYKRFSDAQTDSVNQKQLVRDSKARMVKMMKYYQNPKESDEMVMKPYVVKLSDAQIDTLAEYILNLKK